MSRSQGARYAAVSVGLAFLFCGVPDRLAAEDAENGFRARILNATTSDSSNFLGGSVELDSAIGFDLAYFRQITARTYIEFSYGMVEHDLTFDTPGPGETSYGTLDANPISFLLQFHQKSSEGFDGYVGIGFTYIDYDVREDSDFRALFAGTAVETVVDDQAGPTIQLGFDYRFGREGTHSFGADVRYSLLDTSGILFLDQDAFSQFNLEVDPLYFGVSYAIRF